MNKYSVEMSSIENPNTDSENDPKNLIKEEEEKKALDTLTNTSSNDYKENKKEGNSKLIKVDSDNPDVKTLKKRIIITLI